MTAEIDEVKIALVITNLVENAIKYNKENGWVHVSLNADHKYFYLKVADSGIGIPKEDTDHIFERFFRVDKSHSREIGGTGLGLSIARNAVVMHRGAIKVYSEPGEGTTFTVGSRLLISRGKGEKNEKNYQIISILLAVCLLTGVVGCRKRSRKQMQNTRFTRLTRAERRWFRTAMMEQESRRTKK